MDKIYPPRRNSFQIITMMVHLHRKSRNKISVILDCDTKSLERFKISSDHFLMMSESIEKIINSTLNDECEEDNEIL